MSRRPANTAATFGRYLLFQLPGTVVAALLLATLVRWEQLSLTLGLILFGIWVIGEIAMFPVLRIAYEPDDARGGGTGLEGARGIARGALAPAGWVQIGAERWRAVVADGAAPVAAGTTVRVLEVQGLTLVVEPETGGEVPRDGEEPPASRS